MLAIYVSAVAIVLASLLAGRALFAALGRAEWTWLEGAVGLASLTVLAQLTVHLPGRSTTSAVVIGLVLVVALAYLVRGPGIGLDRESLLLAAPVALVLLLAGAIPFALAGHTGVLGEGIYSNDQAIHLYWADWLQNGIGPEPRGLGLGYPVGPHAVVATVSTTTGASIEAAFNGFMLAIPVLSALTAFAALGKLPPLRRAIAAAVVGMPYLVAAFIAQSSFKEPTVALYVLAFALVLAGFTQPGRLRPLLAAVPLLAVAAVLTLSIPALAWFVLGGGIWLVVALATREIPASVKVLAARTRRAWPLLLGIAIALALLVVLQYDALSRFVNQVDDVQASTGRLLQREPPWQVLGIWPQGDFRASTGSVTGAWVAIAFACIAVLAAAPTWLRRREIAVPAMLLGGLVVYGYALAFAGIHVQAKALTVAAPLVALFVARGLLDPGEEPEEPKLSGRSLLWPSARLALGGLFVLAAAGSTFLALRQAPVGTTERAQQLETLRDRVEGADVVFLGLDRFAPYRLRGARTVRSPGGYLPEPLHAREGKVWVQGDQLDFDSLPSGRYDGYDYAITTSTPYASSTPPNFHEVERTADFILWKREGETQHRSTLAKEGGSPGTVFHCARRDSRLEHEPGLAGVLPRPQVRPDDAWKPAPSFIAPGEAQIELKLPAGRWQLALQYHSEVDLAVAVDASSQSGGSGLLRAQLGPALEGMYAFAPGRGPFWSLGEIKTDGGVVSVTASGAEPSTLERLVHAQRRTWLGRLAFVPVEGAAGAPPGPPQAREIPLGNACERYLDWYQLNP